MISSDWRYDLIIHDMTGKASLPVYLFLVQSISYAFW